MKEGDSVATTAVIRTVTGTARAFSSLTPYCWERTYPVLRQQHQKRAATRLRKQNCLPTVKLTQIYHSTEAPRSMNCGAVIFYSIFKVRYCQPN